MTATLPVVKTSWPRIAAACAVLYPVLVIVGDDVIAGGDAVAPDAGNPAQVLANAAAKDMPSFFLGRSIGLVALVCLLVFGCWLAAQIRRRSEGGEFLSHVVVGTGAVIVALGIVNASAQFAVARMASEGLPPAVAVAVLHAGGGFGIAMLPLCVLLGAVAVEAVRGTVLPRWLGWSAAVLAVALIAGFFAAQVGGPAAGLAFLAVIVQWAWFLAAGISILIRSARPEKS